MSEPSEPAAKHCFVVPAYGASHYLDACLASLQAQVQPSPTVIATSTPNPHIRDIAARYKVPVFEVGSGKGIGADWNAALRAAPGAWVTIAHQDDVYLPRFSLCVSEAFARHPDALLCFTAYREIGAAGPRGKNLSLWIKDALIAAAFLRADAIRPQRRKIRLLAFGSPIPCPSVTLNMTTLGTFEFSTTHRVNLDWLAWLELARREGSFVRLRDVLVRHRIHEASTTWARILDGTRRSEDLECFGLVWPKPVARVLAHIYALSYLGNGG